MLHSHWLMSLVSISLCISIRPWPTLRYGRIVFANWILLGDQFVNHMQKTGPKSDIFHGFLDLLKIWWKMRFLNVYEKVCVELWVWSLYESRMGVKISSNFIRKTLQNPWKMSDLGPVFCMWFTNWSSNKIQLAKTVIRLIVQSFITVGHFLPQQIRPYLRVGHGAVRYSKYPPALDQSDCTNGSRGTITRII